MKKGANFFLISLIFTSIVAGVVLPSFYGSNNPNIALAQDLDGDNHFETPEERAARYASEKAEQDILLAERAAQREADKKANFGLVCWELVPPEFNPGACVALFGYYVFWYPAAAVLMVSAAVFDTAAAWSFNAEILRSGMVSNAWAMVRDIANLGLIFALLYIAIATILQAGGVQLKKAVANVIIVALLINFSFFVTRVVIDISNMFAQSLYSQIGKGLTGTSAPPPISTSALGPKSITSGGGQENVLQVSARIVSVFNPQKFLTRELVEGWDKARDGLSSLFFVFLFSAFVALVAAYAFLRAALLLIGRVVMFVFLIVSSPLAFVAWALPSGGGGFDKKWWSALVDQALVAPVFFLFLYVITTVYNKNLLGGIIGTSDGTNIIPFLVNIALHFIVIIVALLIAVKVTAKLSGAAGSYATKAIGGVVGGAVLGGAALAGRTVVGGAATRLSEREGFKQFVANNPTIGRIVKGGVDRTASATFDFRGFDGVEGLGKANKGGYTADYKSRIKAKEELAKHLGDTRMPEYEQGPSGERMIKKDEQGNIVYQTKKVFNKQTKEEDVVNKTAKDVYAEKLEKERWALSSMKAAKNIKKGKTKEQELLEEFKKGLKEEAETEKPKEAEAPKEEKPKEA